MMRKMDVLTSLAFRDLPNDVSYVEYSETSLISTMNMYLFKGFRFCDVLPGKVSV